MPLLEALALCRQCQELTPFFFSPETFAQVASVISQEVMERLLGVERQILKNTVQNYVTGQIERKELETVFRHLDKRWRAARVAKPAPESVPAVQPQPQAS